MPETLRVHPWKCGGGQKGGKEGGKEERGPSPTQLIGVVCELGSGYRNQ